MIEAALSSSTGVPNGTLRQDYWQAALVADSQEVVDVNMPKVVALSPSF